MSPSRGKLARSLTIAPALLIALLIAVLAVPGWQWYRWATSAASPYDEVWIGLNA